jgi:PIN domain nuclease of toxin-antitoxin system
VRDRPEYDGPLLLDTHIWFWWLNADVKNLHAKAITVLEQASLGGGLAVCDISCWELAQKANRGLHLGLSVETWLARATTAPGITMLPLSRDVLVLGTQLHQMQGDPADRWIVATAKLQRLPLATADSSIIEFAKLDGLTAVCDMRR